MESMLSRDSLVYVVYTVIIVHLLQNKLFIVVVDNSNCEGDF